MNLNDLLSTLARHKILTLLVLAVTGALWLSALALVPPSYETKASILLIPPLDREHRGNRFLELGTLSQARDVLMRRLNSDQVHEAVAEGGVAGDFLVEQDWTTGAPILVLTASADSPDGSTKLIYAVLNQSGEQLAELQDNLSIGENDQIALTTVSEGRPKEAGKARLRATVLAVGLGLVGGVFGIGLFDRFSMRRRGRGTDGQASEDWVAALWASPDPVPGSRGTNGQRHDRDRFVTPERP